jgi:phospholipid/cholesterol/gamma-HCH transport system substrate-binding protein
MSEPAIQDDFRSGRARGQILALLLVAVLLAVSLVLAIAYRHDAFARTADIYFETDSASGLLQGTAVTLSGFRIGEVSGVSLLPNMNVKVVMTIRAEHLPKIRADASVELLKEDLLKPAVLAIDKGKSDQLLSPLAPQIQFSRPESFADMASDLKGRIAPILDDVKQITGTLRQRQDRLGEIMEEAANAARELAHAAKEINAMSTDIRKQVSIIGDQSVSTLTEANQTVVRLNGVIAQAERSVGTINGSLPQLVREANATLESVQAVARDARTISQAAAETLPGTLRNVQPAAEDAREIMRGVTRAWPIRDLLPAPPPAVVPLDSMDARKLREPAAK